MSSYYWDTTLDDPAYEAIKQHICEPPDAQAIWPYLVGPVNERDLKYDVTDLDTDAESAVFAIYCWAFCVPLRGRLDGEPKLMTARGWCYVDNARFWHDQN